MHSPKFILKKIITKLRLQKFAYYIFSLYASIFRFHKVIRDGICYQLDLRESVDRGIYLLGWEPLTIKWMIENLKTGDVVIEVGANVGAHSLIISKIIGPNGSLDAFEPTDYAFKKLQTNFSLNPALSQNTNLHQLYVSNAENLKSKHKIRSSWIVNKSDEIANKMDEEYIGEIVTLDQFFIDLDRLDFLKIDVDGFDFKVLEGAKGIIQRLRPTVFIELSEIDLNRNDSSVKDIINYFDEINYHGSLENGLEITTGEALIEFLKGSTHTNGIFKPIE
jgi:FkbM family methyltransferase